MLCGNSRYPPQKGGIGITSGAFPSPFGANGYFAGGGGGGGGGVPSYNDAVGGLGGGGDGCYSGDNPLGSGENGQNNTGGCGGGGYGSPNTGSNGGKGVVIIRYANNGSNTATGGTITTTPSYVIHTFTGDSTFATNADFGDTQTLSGYSIN